MQCARSQLNANLYNGNAGHLANSLGIGATSGHFIWKYSTPLRNTIYIVFADYRLGLIDEPQELYR